MEAGAEYPKMLFRPGSTLRVWNAHDVDTLIVDDAAAELEAKRQGWSESPAPSGALDHDHDGKPGGSLPGRRKKP
jgi:hypothetical protein